MLPDKKKKPSIWRAFKGMRSIEPKSSQATHSHPFGSNDREATQNVISDLQQPKVKRQRAFTGQINISQAGMPQSNNYRVTILRIGIALFLIADIVLLILFFRSVSH